MAGKIIDGKQIAADIRAELKKEVAELGKKGIVPGLGVILVGENPASKTYVGAKERACEEVGIFCDNNRLPEETSQEELLAIVHKMNGDDKINGILVQLPLPKHLNENEALLAVDPNKDVDGFHPLSTGKILAGLETFLSCTPFGIIQMLTRSGIKTEGANVVIVGRSYIVGKPLANMLIQDNPEANATVTVCHNHTKNLSQHTLQADIIVVETYQPNTITADMVKEGVVVIDVGANRIKDETRKSGYRLVGDVDFEAVKEKASFITPVPGGVGPMTVTMLLYNTVESAKRAVAAK